MDTPPPTITLLQGEKDLLALHRAPPHVLYTIIKQWDQDPRRSLWLYMKNEYRWHLVAIGVCYAIIIAVIVFITYAVGFM